jgi:hypothetical protein
MGIFLVCVCVSVSVVPRSPVYTDNILPTWILIDPLDILRLLVVVFRNHKLFYL